MADSAKQPNYVSISPLLKRMSTMDAPKNVKAEEVAGAVSLIFTNSISPVQFSLLLWALHVTAGDHDSGVLSHCARAMREAAAQVDEIALTEVVKRRGRVEGRYQGGLVSQSQSKKLLSTYLWLTSFSTV